MKTLMELTLGVSLLGLLAACSGQNLDKSPSAVDNINLEQDYQEVVRYDCNNKVISDRIETVASPTQWVTINPSDWSNVGSSTFLNTSTGSTAPMVSNLTTFVVDHGNGALSMHVITGANTIQYTFYTTTNTVKEQGTLNINVSYVEKTIPTPLQVNQCVTPTPTPIPNPTTLIN